MDKKKLLMEMTFWPMVILAAFLTMSWSMTIDSFMDRGGKPSTKDISLLVTAVLALTMLIADQVLDMMKGKKIKESKKLSLIQMSLFALSFILLIASFSIEWNDQHDLYKMSQEARKSPFWSKLDVKFKDYLSYSWLIHNIVFGITMSVSLVSYGTYMVMNNK